MWHVSHNTFQWGGGEFSIRSMLITFGAIVASDRNTVAHIWANGSDHYQPLTRTCGYVCFRTTGGQSAADTAGTQTRNLSIMRWLYHRNLLRNNMCKRADTNAHLWKGSILEEIFKKMTFWLKTSHITIKAESHFYSPPPSTSFWILSWLLGMSQRK